MAIRNLIEAVVRSVVDEVLKKNKDLAEKNTNKDDIVAYVLNRIPPKYVTSERGILHGKLHVKFEIQAKTDILLLIYEAISVIKKRRAVEYDLNNIEQKDVEHHFPHIMGEILEESTFSMIPDVEVSLMHNGNLVKMVDLDWKNPYLTNKSTMGYYHFWPDNLEKKSSKDSKINFNLIFKHPKFNQKNIDIEVELSSSADIGRSYKVPIVLIQLKEGIDPDFLYKE